MLDLKFGLDPEVFSTVLINNEEFVISPALLEKDSNLKPVIKDKTNKHPIYIKEKDFSWMQDGCAWESTYYKIFKNAKEIHETVNDSLNCLQEFMKNLTWMNMGLNLYKKPVVKIKPDMYLPFLEDIKIYQGFIFGCDPDYDAIDTNYNCETKDVFTHLFRYGGGHFHISGMEQFKNNYLQAIKLLALTVGNFCILNSPYPELEKQRATTYGRPGRFRPQKYPNGDFGIEYRTPSNSWISLSENKMEELIFWANKGCEYLLLPDNGNELINELLSPTINAIINADKKLSENILNNLL